MYIFIGLVVGSMFFQFGNDGSMTIFNYGFMFITVIVFMYTPLLPVLLRCEFCFMIHTLFFKLVTVFYVFVICSVILVPTEVRLLKREYFNRWYGLNAYFCALTFSQLPMQVRIEFSVILTCSGVRQIELCSFLKIIKKYVSFFFFFF